MSDFYQHFLTDKSFFSFKGVEKEIQIYSYWWLGGLFLYSFTQIKRY